MKINELKSTLTSNTKRKRVGRGSGSGLGKTAGRGFNGQKSRSGVAIKGFEGGQMPLQRRVPKFGFKNINRIDSQAVNLDTIQLLIDNKKVKGSMDIQSFIDNGLAKKKDLIKVLATGKINSPIKITAHKFSATAKAAIEKSGGEAIIL